VITRTLRNEITTNRYTAVARFFTETKFGLGDVTSNARCLIAEVETSALVTGPISLLEFRSLTLDTGTLGPIDKNVTEWTDPIRISTMTTTRHGMNPSP
jgi:hypothetical protein